MIHPCDCELNNSSMIFHKFCGMFKFCTQQMVTEVGHGLSRSWGKPNTLPNL